ncbi:MAG: hypothetical protein E7394_02415 [Ruminococcaceae bacterium]|nr:hypothetical protein [Oscillospiraceae bacterium]
MKRVLSFILMLSIMFSINVCAAEDAGVLIGNGKCYSIYAVDGKYTLEPGYSYYVTPRKPITGSVSYTGPVNLANASAKGDIRTYSLSTGELLSESTGSIMATINFAPGTYKVITPLDKKQLYANQLIVAMYGEYRYVNVPGGETVAFSVSEDAKFSGNAFNSFFQRFDKSKNLVDEGIGKGEMSLDAGDTVVVFSKSKSTTKYPVITDGKITMEDPSGFQSDVNGQYEIKGEYDVVVGGTSEYILVDKTTQKEVKNKVVWSSSNNLVANMLSNGCLVAKTPGETEITASFLGSDSKITRTVSVRRPEMRDICFDIDNSLEEFGISDMPLIVYRATNSNPWLFNALSDIMGSGDGTGGLCAGFCMTSILFSQGDLKVKDYGADKIYKISKTNERIRNRICYQFMMQDDLYKNERATNKGKIMEIVAKAIKYQETGKQPFIITVRVENSNESIGHALMPYRVEDTSTYTKVYVYDCNQAYSQYTNLNDGFEAYIYFDKTDGKYNNTWKFEREYYSGKTKVPAGFESGTQGAWISYVSYDTILKETEKGSLYGKNKDWLNLFSVEEPEIIIVRDAEDVDITDSMGNKCSIKGWTVDSDIAGLTYMENHGETNRLTHYLTAADGKYSVKGFSDKDVTLHLSKGETITSVKTKDTSKVEFEYASDNITPDICITSDNSEDFSVENAYYDSSLKYDSINLSGTHGGNLSITSSGSEFIVSGVRSIKLDVTASGETSTIEADNLNEEVSYSIIIDGRNFYLKNADGAELSSLKISSKSSTAKPVAKLAEGEYNQAQVLEFEDVDDDTIIYYTTDGSTPDSESLVYSGPIIIDSTIRVRAKAMKYGYNMSSTVTLDYTLPDVSEPVADVASGSYDVMQKVTLSTTAEDAEIYYTTDGSDPKVNGKLYQKPIQIKNDCVLKTYAVEDNCCSAVAEYTYEISIDEIYVTSAQCIDGNVSVELEEANDKDVSVIVAVYDESGNMEKVSFHKETVTDGLITFNSGIFDENAQIYVWDGMKPCR